MHPGGPGKGPPRDRDDRGAGAPRQGGYDRDCGGTRVSGEEQRIFAGIYLANMYLCMYLK